MCGIIGYVGGRPCERLLFEGQVVSAGIGHTRWATHGGVVPDRDPLLQVMLGIVPLQLFAYHVARARGLNVDQPRNLAKTVTVE